MRKKTFNKVVEQHADSLYRYALKQAGSESLAGDFVQDAFEVLWQKRNQVDRSRIRSYLYSIVHHRIIDYHRKMQREVDYEGISGDQYYYFQEYKGAKEMIDHLLDQLSTEQKSVLLLRDYEGYSYKEIAAITSLSESQVKVYIHRARKYLRNYIVKKDNLL